MLTAGQRIDRYVIEGQLGAGGMGEVYAAHDERLERTVALKLLPKRRELDLVARGRMLREARAASALKHPGIVTVHEIGEADGRTFIVMELVEGETLAELVERRGRLPVREALELVRQVGEALSLAHEAGIVHRDIKPENLMIDERGQVKVLDFGLSKRVGDEATAATVDASSSPPGERSEADRVAEQVTEPAVSADQVAEQVTGLAVSETVDATDRAPTGRRERLSSRPRPDEPQTALGIRMGTPGWAAIELMRGQDADQRSDIFSLAAVLYALVTGTRPFRGTSWAEIEDAIESQSYVPASEASEGAVDSGFDRALAPALHPDPRQRYQRVEDLLAVVERVVTDSARGAGARWARYAIVAAGLLVAGAGLLAWRAGWGGSRGAATPVVATGEASDGGAIGESSPVALGAVRPLTELGACAYAPTFADDQTVVFDLTRSDAVDLYAVKLADGAVTRLTDQPGWEWRAVSAGRPGQVVFVRNAAEGDHRPESTGIELLDLASGERRVLSHADTATAVMIGDTTYYMRVDQPELRRVRGGADEVEAVLDPQYDSNQMVASADGARLAMVTSGSGQRLCVLEMADHSVSCQSQGRVYPSRPAFSPDGARLYYGVPDGIHQLEIDTGADRLVAPELAATGGLAVSPDGGTLVYSDCQARARLLDASESPPRQVIDDPLVREAALGPGGELAWVRVAPEGSVLMVRTGDGMIRQLTNARHGRPMSPDFDPTGGRIAVVLRGESSGIFVVSLDRPIVRQVTDGPADQQPVWLADGRLAFTRLDADAQPRVHVVDPDQGVISAVALPPRYLNGFDRATGRGLVSTPDGGVLYWWDPVTDRQTRVTLPFPELTGQSRFPVLSPGGRWLIVQSGTFDQKVHRIDLTAAEPRAELVYQAPEGQTLSKCSVTDEGHVLVAPQVWSGELYALPARAGARF